jgi:hypothetical protein
MSLFDRFKKHTAPAFVAKAHAVNATKDGVLIDGTPVSPLTVASLTAVLGEARVVPPGETGTAKNHVLLWDAAGIRGYAKDLDEGAVSEINLMLCDDPDRKPNYDKSVYHPRAAFSGAFSLDSKPALEGIPEKTLRETYIFAETKRGNWEISFCLTEAAQARVKADADNTADIIRGDKTPFSWAYISYNAPRVSTEKYRHKKPEGATLTFTNFNFKLAIVQELMYNLHLLAPAFDVYDFASDYAKREIDPDGEGYEVIPEVKKWFKDLPVSADLADKVESLCLDGGDDVYLQVCPQWDGEDETFDIGAIAAEELAQFPKLRRVETLGIALSAKARKTLAASGVEVAE